MEYAQTLVPTEVLKYIDHLTFPESPSYNITK